MHRTTITIALAALLAPTPSAQINAPVAPDAIYVGRHLEGAGLSIVDLNGFGQGTGNPAYDLFFSPASEGKSNFPNNPNVALQGSLLIPPLMPGTTTLDGGSAGVFTLTRDANLTDFLVPAGGIGRLGDMMLGGPLDVLFNAGPAPFGCQSGGGSLCSFTGLKDVGGKPGPGGGLVPIGGGGSFGGNGLGNPISWAPHPNPPPLLPLPLCASPEIRGQEPTSVDSWGMGFTNLLVPGDALGNPTLGIPPSGLLGSVENTFFVGPSPPAASIAQCSSYHIRQQIGHLLYAVDLDNDEVVVLNSNRLTVLDRIALPDPTELAIDPELRFLAVTNRSTDSVSFIDISPSSSTFHQVVVHTAVGSAPSGITWDPGGEDILVCNEGDDSVSILSAFDFNVRKTLQAGFARPFAVVATPRQAYFGSLSNVYYAWILDRDGLVWLFESGPDGVNGWGHDEVIGRTRFRLRTPLAMQIDPLALGSGVWIAHEGSLAATGKPTGVPGGALTRLRLDNPAFGQVTLIPGQAPGMRGKSIHVAQSIGGDVLTGQPRDLAFDNLHNLGLLGTHANPFAAGAPAPLNSKHPVRQLGIVMTPTNQPRYLFAPVRDALTGTERIDVIELATGQRVDTNPFQGGVQSIPARGAFLVMDYFRQ